MWWLSVYGLTFSIKDAKLLKVPREKLKRIGFFKKLLSCPFCVGFWSGITVDLALTANDLLTVQHVVCGGLAGAAISYLSDLCALGLEKFAYGSDANGPADLND